MKSSGEQACTAVFSKGGIRDDVLPLDNGMQYVEEKQKKCCNFLCSWRINK